MNEILSFLNRFLKIYLILVVMVFTSELSAQVLKLDIKSYAITISGTTNIHNFESKVTQLNAEIILNTSKQIQTLTVVIPVKSIKSGDKLMDSKTYETFNAVTYPNITFQLVEIKSLKVIGTEINTVLVGTITMGGIAKTVSLKAQGQIIKNGVYNFKGNIHIKMTDFNMKPPTAMMGLMKVGDEIIVNFSVIFEGSTTFNYDK